MPSRSLRYSQHDVLKAIDEVSRGMSVAAAAKKHGIPRITLLYKVRGKNPVERRMGPKSYLTTEQEDTLVKWIISLSKAGFPVTMNQLQNCVKKLVTELRLSTPFKDNRPGRHWCEGFKKRHPEISTRVAQNLTETRASVTKELLDTWFKEVFTYLETNKYEHVLNQPERVFNCDETAFFLNPKGSKVLAPRGDKTIYQKVNPDEKECLTVLLTGNAAGDTPPPMIIFKYERIPRELALSVPDNWGIGRSDKGWMTGETFFEFISNIFNPWLEEKQIQKPVILFIDGHSSHLTLHTSKFCSENGIILVALYPNATHLIQPMDVAVFGSLKGNWREAVREWRLENNDEPILRKVQFSPLLKKVLDKTLKPSLFRNGFRKCKCGLIPWNPDAVDINKNTSTIAQLKDNEKKVTELQNGLKFIEKHINHDKLISFKRSNIWMGDKEDTSLFLFWQNISDQYEASKESLNLMRQTRCSALESTEHSESNNVSRPFSPTCSSVTVPIIQESLNADNNDAKDLPVKITDAQTNNTLQQNQVLEGPHTQISNTKNNAVHVGNFLSKPTTSVDNTGSVVEVNQSRTINVTDFSQKPNILARNDAVMPISPVSSPINFLNDSEVEEALSNLEPLCPLVAEKIITPDKSHTLVPNFITPTKVDSLCITVLTNTTNTITNAACTPISKNVSVEPMPGTSTYDPSIPTPFKRIIFWPQQKQMPFKKRKIGKIPAVVTSNKWQEYYENKDKKKDLLLLEKQKRLEERKKNREKKEADKNAKQNLKENRKKEAEKNAKQNLKEIRKIEADQKKNQSRGETCSDNKGRAKPIQVIKKTLFESDSEAADESSFTYLKIKPKNSKPQVTKIKKSGLKTGIYKKLSVTSTSESEDEEWQESKGSPNDVSSEDERIF